MRIAIAHTGPISELVAATCVNNGIQKQPINPDITWIVSDENTYLFKYNKNVKTVVSRTGFAKSREEYDLYINLWPDAIISKAKALECTGFGYHQDFDKFTGAVFGTDAFPEMSVLQLYFILSGMTWRGEGYDIGYYPKTKSKKNRVGMSAANANLRNYVLDNLELDDAKIWYIPYKKNIFKKMDEINRCQKVITDDLLTFHLALALRKQVYYLETLPHTLRLETFNSGQVHTVPCSYLK